MTVAKIMSRAEALVESQRCLGCYDAPCIQACPARVNIPGFIRRLREENVQGAGDILYQACPLAATCGMACPTDTLCEGACVLKDLGQTPVRIGALQTYTACLYNGCEGRGTQAIPAQVAVVGAGPSGIGCAVVLNRLGHRVDVYEQTNQLAGLVDQVIPAYRLPAAVVDFDLKRLDQSGIKFHYGRRVDQQLANELLDQYDLAFIGAGLGNINPFSAAGAENSGVVSAMDYLQSTRRKARAGEPHNESAKVVAIIGGGNVALDAAITAKRSGAERVIVLYRRTKDEMPGWEREYLEAASLGVEFRWLSVVEEVVGSGASLTGVQISSMLLSDAGADGRRSIVPDATADKYFLPCSKVIHALGQKLDETTAVNFGLTTRSRAVILANPVTGQTSHPRVYAAGECVSGGSTIVASMSSGMAAARKIDQYLRETAGEK